MKSDICNLISKGKVNKIDMNKILWKELEASLYPHMFALMGRYKTQAYV